MSSLIKNILIVAVLCGALYAGYHFFFANTDPNLVLEAGANEGDLLASEFLMRLNEIETLSFSREFFDDPRLRSLESFSSEPDQVSAGRSNPFAR